MAETFRIINIDVTKPEQTALVYSATNPSRVNMGSVTFGDQLPFVLRFVGNGDLDNLNGDSSYTWRVAIGDLGGTLYAQTNTVHYSSSYGLTGSLNLSTTPLSASLIGEDSIISTFEVEGFNSTTGRRKTFLQVPITIYNEVISSSVSPVSASQYYTTTEADARYSLKGEVAGGWNTGSGLTYTNLNVGVNIATPSVDFEVQGVGYFTTLTASLFTASKANITDSFHTRLTGSNALLTSGTVTTLTSTNSTLTNANITSLTASNSSLTKLTASNALFTQASSTGLTSSISSPLVTATDGNFTRFTGSTALITKLTATQVTGSGDITFVGTTANTLAKIVGNKISSSAIYEVGNALGVGTATPSAVSDALMVVLKDNSSPTVSSSIGLDAFHRLSGIGVSNEVLGGRVHCQAMTSAVVWSGKFIGLRAESLNNVASSQFSEMIGLQAQNRSNATCTVTSSYGVLVNKTLTLGTVTNDYGVYVATPSAGTYTNKYGLYVQDPDARNFFAGFVGVGPNATASVSSEMVRVTGAGYFGSASLNMAPSQTTFLNITSSTTTKSQLRLSPGAAVSAPQNGDIWNDSDLGLCLQEASQIGHIPLVIQRQSATVSRNSATSGAQTLLSPSLNLPANFLRAGQVIHIKAWGYHTVVTPPSHTVQVKLTISGAAEVTLLDFGAVSMGTNTTNGDWHLDAYVTVRSTGASGTVVADGELQYDIGGTESQVHDSSVGTITVNTTITQSLSLSVTMASGDSSDKWECQQASITVL